jgi:hypothetical protein
MSDPSYPSSLLSISQTMIKYMNRRKIMCRKYVNLIDIMCFVIITYITLEFQVIYSVITLYLYFLLHLYPNCCFLTQILIKIWLIILLRLTCLIFLENAMNDAISSAPISPKCLKLRSTFYASILKPYFLAISSASSRLRGLLTFSN